MNDFPPVCAMTGAPAETWRKFRFVTAPGWAYLFLLLLCTGIGLILIFLIMRLVSRTAGGHLPLTHSASKRITIGSLIGVALLVLWLALWVMGFTFSDKTASGVSFSLGLLGMFCFVVYWLLVRPRFGPGGKVLAIPPGQYQSIVVIDRVHPAFVAAVQNHQQARAAQWMASSQSPNLPEAK